MLLGSPDGAPQHGFGLIIGTQPQSYLFVEGRANSAEYESAKAAAMQVLRYLRDQGKEIVSSTIGETKLDQLPASRIVITYRCPESTERYVRSSTLALGSGKAIVFEITFYSRESRYDQDRAVLDQMLKSWKYLGPWRN